MAVTSRTVNNALPARWTAAQTLFTVILSACMIAIAVVASSIDGNEDARGHSTTVSPSTLAPIFRESDHDAPGTSSSGYKSTETHADSNNKDTDVGFAQARLMKELRGIYKSDSHKKGILEVELVNDNLQEWNVKLFVSEEPMRGDLLKLKQMGRKDHIMLRLSFSKNFPAEPPFVRVVYPVLKGRFMCGGGAMCMDIMTNRGWISSCSIETFILTILLAFEEKGMIRVEFDENKLEKYGHEYNEEYAKKQFRIMKEAHERLGGSADNA